MNSIEYIFLILLQFGKNERLSSTSAFNLFTVYGFVGMPRKYRLPAAFLKQKLIIFLISWLQIPFMRYKEERTMKP